MKYINILLIIFYLQGCGKDSNKAELEKFEKLSENKNAIIISCNKCGCIINALNDVYAKSPGLVKSYNIYGDSACLQGLDRNIIYINLQQQAIDSISTQFHNLIIVKKEENHCSCRMINTNEAENLSRFLK
jgi:hypothetical protein